MTIRNGMTLASIQANAGLTAALKMNRAGVIGAIRSSGMKGRGGAGFPTGVKWNLAAAAQGPRSTSSATPTRASPARSRTG